MIWRSPVWMPLAWEVVALQFGYIGLAIVGALRQNRPGVDRIARRDKYSVFTKKWPAGFIVVGIQRCAK